MRKYDDVLKPFVLMMEKELHANAGKGDRPGWLAMSADTCLLEIIYHFGKLQASVKRGDIEGITEYAADVANMAMMLVDICGALPAQENHISERDQLKAENEALLKEQDSWRKYAEETRKALKEVAELRKDAERHRWLRTNEFDIGSYHGTHEHNVSAWFEHISDESIDEMIAEEAKFAKESDNG